MNNDDDDDYDDDDDDHNNKKTNFCCAQVFGAQRHLQTKWVDTLEISKQY